MTSSPRQPRAALIDIPTLADQLGTTHRHIRRLVAERRIPYLKIGALVRFDPADINTWLNSTRRPTATAQHEHRHGTSRAS